MRSLPINKSVLFSACVAALVAGTAVGAFAQASTPGVAARAAPPRVLPPGSALPNFDIRAGLPQRLPMNRANAARALQSALGGATINFSAATGGVSQLFRRGGYLTLGGGGNAESIVRSFIGRNQAVFGLSAGELSAFELARADLDAATRVTHVFLKQRVGGRDVFGALIKGHVDSRGRLVSLEGSYLPGTTGPRTAAVLSARQALMAALRSSLPEVVAKAEPNQRPRAPGPGSSLRLGPAAAQSFPTALRASSGADQSTTFAAGPFSAPLVARQVVFPTASGSVLAWEVSAKDRARAVAYRLVVDAGNGRLLYRQNLVHHAANSNASVFTKNPDATPLAVKPFRGPLSLSPARWSDGLATIGNNVQGDSAVPLSGIHFTYPFTDSWKAAVADDFDLANLRVRFIPTDSLAHSYTVSTAAAGSTAAAATDLLPLFSNTDDDTTNIVCGTPWTANILGNTYTSFFVNTNGSLGFGAGSADDFPSKVSFANSALRIAGLWRDLNPGGGGTLTGDCATEGGGTRIRVVWNGVPNSGLGGSHTFAITVHGVGTGLDNVIDIDYGAVSSATGELVGVGGNPGAEDDLTTTGIVSYRDLNAGSVSGVAGSTPNGIAQTFPGNDLNLSITNLSYQLNLMHDTFQSLGFDEAAGNFQTNNFGNGGTERDPVLAEAQFGLGAINEIFFETGPDGLPGFMATGLFDTNAGACLRDSSFDASLIRHEFTHGVSARMVGGPAAGFALESFQGAALGEGWSDAFAITTLNDPVIGAYVACDPDGISSAPYNANPANYALFGNRGGPFAAGIGRIFAPEEHIDGEIWAAAAWDMHVSLGEPATRELLFEAMRYAPVEPTMVQARDAVLIADSVLFGGSHTNQLWSIFANRGLGASASSSAGSFDFGGLFGGFQTTVFAASDVPATRYASAPQKVIYKDDFETGAPGWFVVGADGAGGPTLWHLSQLASSSSSHAFYYGSDANQDYDTGFRNYGSIVSPVIQLPNITATQSLALEWDQLRTTDDPFFFDAGTVQIRDLDAPARKQVAFVQNTETLFFDPNFQHQKVSLRQFAGKRIRVEFFMDTFDAANNTGAGWFVDNVKVTLLAPPPVISIRDATAPEGDSGDANSSSTVVSLSAPTTATVTVQYRTGDATAVAPGDYTALPLSTLSFSPGEVSKTISVPVKGDNTAESNETFLIRLGNPRHASIGDSRAKVTILNDD
jgi:hypothetical protein